MNSTTAALVVRSGPEEEDGGGGGGAEKEQLSVDDIAEIFARLPVKSLMRFRCVSKLWYNLILSPNFISLHNTHSHRNNKVVTLWLNSCNQAVSDTTTSAGTHTKTTVSFRFGEDIVERQLFDDLFSYFFRPKTKEDVVKELTFNSYMKLLGCVKIVGCFHGVVCLSLSRSPQSYALWNPATGHVREIGDSPMDGPLRSEPEFLEKYCGSYCSGFCFDPVTNSFKVAQIQLSVTRTWTANYDSCSTATRAQVNVFSTATNSWTEKDMILPCGVELGCYNNIRGATCVNGYMHWHIAIFPDRWASEDMCILSYDMISEVFQRIEMPSIERPSRPVFAQYLLAAYQGALAIFIRRWNSSDRSYNEVDLWVMNKDSGGSDQSWSKILTWKPSIEVTCVVGFFRKDGVDFILFHSRPNNSYYVYDPVSGETKKLRIRESISETFPYNESLVSLN